MAYLIAAAIAVVVMVATYLVWIRPWHLRWGATEEESATAMVGDDIVARPHFAATRAVTVEAPPQAIWPWLVQMGFWRAGWYSYDWIDHLGKASARRIIPALQCLKAGDVIPFTPKGILGMRVIGLEPNRWMLWQDKRDGGTWLWRLDPLGESRTRLIARRRIRYRWNSPWVIYQLLQDVADIVMMRKCLLGIKARAESAPQPDGRRCEQD